MISLIDTGNFKHDGGELLTWQQENLELKKNESEEVKFVKSDKQVSGLVAIALAMHEHQLDRSEPGFNFAPISEVNI